MSDKIKVLVIDDDPSTLDLFKVRLKDKFDLYLAQNGEDGLNFKKENDIKIILTDIMIDIEDGFQILQKLRKNDPTCRVYAMTANHEMDELIHCLSNGFNDYFSKPVDFQALTDSIEDASGKMARWHS